MKIKFGYFSKKDNNEEIIDIINTYDINSAVEIFALRKKLTIDLFLELFKVKRITDGK